jgi:putative methyltransferase (TIGR04325 family)
MIVGSGVIQGGVMVDLYKVKEVVKRLPPVKRFMRSKYEKKFRTAEHCNLFNGIYMSFDEAQLNIPTTKSLGYDNIQSAKMYLERTKQVYLNDYPVLFWLQKILPTATRLYEIGGHIGVSYYSYRNYVDYPAGFEWVINDVPAVVDRGIEVARENNETQLSFTQVHHLSEPTDILFSSGALQYIEQPLYEFLKSEVHTPKHILISLLPVNDLPNYVTLQNIGTAYCPYIIRNEQQFVDEIKGLGYRLVDVWDNPDKRCSIPFQDDKYSLDHYKGYYFSKVSA